MTKQIAIIDPFVKTPAIHCFNDLVRLLKVPLSYHMPSLTGLSSLRVFSEDCSGYMVLGSASHIHENLAWHRELGDFLVAELTLRKPVLGCCFGHQLICHALGSTVEYYGSPEDKLSGVREIIVDRDFWNFQGGESFTLGITHRQFVSQLGPNLQAVNRGFPHDLVIHDSLPFLGTQAHPEASVHFIQNDIGALSPDQINQARCHGGQLIKRFFSHFGL